MRTRERWKGTLIGQHTFVSQYLLLSGFPATKRMNTPIKSLKHTNKSISFLNHKPSCSRNYISHSRKDIGSSHLFLKQTPLDSLSQCSMWHHKWYNSPPHGCCQPVWPSSKALCWLAEGPRFESALALLSLQKLWSADTVLWLCPSQLMKH